MNSITDAMVIIQTSSHSVPSTPSWFGEVVLIIEHLHQQGVLTTHEVARQRALPQAEELPPAFRRLDELCAPGYTGRKRGEIVRTRTVVNQAHTSQWFGSFGNQFTVCLGRIDGWHELVRQVGLQG